MSHGYMHPDAVRARLRERQLAAAAFKRSRRSHKVTAGSIGRERPAWQRPSARSDSPPRRLAEALIPTDVRAASLAIR